MAPSPSSSSSSDAKKVSIHPLAISAVCDHYTRVTVGGSMLPSNSAVIGLLFGTISPGVISIFDATDVNYTFNPDHPEEVAIVTPTEVCPNFLQISFFFLFL